MSYITALQSFDYSKASQTADTMNQHNLSLPSTSIDIESKRFERYFKPSLVNAKFLDMKMQLEHMLKDCNLQKFYEQCKRMMASHDHAIILFLNEFLKNVALLHKFCKS